MIIIKLQGGLGNQLFIYALYKSLLAMGRQVKIDEVSRMQTDKQRVPLLDKLGLDVVSATDDEVRAMRDAYMDPYHRIRRKIFGRKSKDYFEPADGNYSARIKDLDDVYLDGFFQSEKYFEGEDIRESLKTEILGRRDDIIALSDPDLLKAVCDPAAVSVHIRRGDYLWPGVAKTYGGICTESYYDKAMEIMAGRIDKPRYIFFSNDIDWCRERYGSLDGVVFVSESGENRDLKEFFLMSLCRNHIIANSSYSWWGAYLGERGGVTLAPHKWINNKDMSDIYSDWMEKVPAR
ncbi:alpha-1,2-fucosyltransferase [Butyrivibrio sp. MC2013]|uniref:alpha-1,2-fucosyltransferase n=1 Tax=Butyrivibrio sp. MC2013 TaxID=1280686 RepID=UPI0004129F96|nr:alpha-1,2-fucosyltransferase [Butyrivibrio sp. MC2013]